MRITKISFLGMILAGIVSNSFADNIYNQVNAIPPKLTTSSEQNQFLDGTFSGSIDVTSNYVFRGISETNNNPAIQGGLAYTLKSTGIYVDIWASNVNFLDAHGDRATIEVDTTAGVSNPIGDNFTYDIHLERYNYPQAPAASYNELYTIADYRFLEGTIGYTPNVYNTHKTGIYYELGVNFDIPAQYIYFEGISVEATVGHYSLPRSVGLNSYNNYSAQINKKISRYIFSLQWTGTDGRANEAPLDSNHVIGTLAVSFG